MTWEQWWELTKMDLLVALCFSALVFFGTGLLLRVMNLKEKK